MTVCVRKRENKIPYTMMGYSTVITSHPSSLYSTVYMRKLLPHTKFHFREPLAHGAFFFTVIIFRISLQYILWSGQGPRPVVACYSHETSTVMPPVHGALLITESPTAMWRSHSRHPLPLLIT